MFGKVLPYHIRSMDKDSNLFDNDLEVSILRFFQSVLSHSEPNNLITCHYISILFLYSETVFILKKL